MLILKYHKNTLPLSPKIGVFFMFIDLIKNLKQSHQSTDYPSLNRTIYLASVNKELFTDLICQLFPNPTIQLKIDGFKYVISCQYENIYIYWDGTQLTLNVKNRAFSTNRLDKYWLVSTIAYNL